jgi:hypothetical protein
LSILKWFIPSKVRRVAHPIGYTKRRLTPKPVRMVHYAFHPVGTATSAGTRRLLRKPRKPVYHHGTCTVNHRSRETASRCRRRT